MVKKFILITICLFASFNIFAEIIEAKNAPQFTFIKSTKGNSGMQMNCFGEYPFNNIDCKIQLLIISGAKNCKISVFSYEGKYKKIADRKWIRTTAGRGCGLMESELIEQDPDEPDYWTITSTPIGMISDTQVCKEFYDKYPKTIEVWSSKYGKEIPLHCNKIILE